MLTIQVFGNDGETWNCEFSKADPADQDVAIFSKGGTVQLRSLEAWRLKV
jgi:hypothetical protein